jgi:hypothetical protein
VVMAGTMRSSGKDVSSLVNTPQEKLCFLRGMKRGPLGLHVLNELPDSLGCLLVGYAGPKASIVLDLPVEFNALSHIDHFRIRRTALFA